MDGPKGTWVTRIYEMGIEVAGGDSRQFPVLRSSYKVGDAYGGDVSAFPHLAVFTFQTRRKDTPEAQPLNLDASGLIEKLKEFEWGQPYNIEEVYAQIQGAGILAEEKDIVGFFAKCEELRTDWKKHVTE